MVKDLIWMVKCKGGYDFRVIASLYFGSIYFKITLWLLPLTTTI